MGMKDNLELVSNQPRVQEELAKIAKIDAELKDIDSRQSSLSARTSGPVRFHGHSTASTPTWGPSPRGAPGAPELRHRSKLK